MQRQLWRALVFRRSPHDEELARLHGYCGKFPLGEVRRIVGQRPIGENEWSCARIVNFDPVRIRAVFVGAERNIVRHELRDDRISAGDV